MYYQNKDHNLRNIKKTPEGHYQIQFVRNGKSYSDFSVDLAEAKTKRDELESKLGLINLQFNDEPRSGKESMIPDTNEPMQAGLSLYYSEKRKQYHVLVHWFRSDKKARSKAFYAGTINTHDHGKGDEGHARAVEFRNAWELAMKDGRVDEFNPAEFNL